MAITFGDPVVTMATDKFMDLPPNGFYMGQRVGAGVLYSKYSDGIEANIPGDSLSPSPLSFDGQQMIQTSDIVTVPAGEAVTTINFIRPLTNEKAQEFLGNKGGIGSGAEIYEASFEPFSPGEYQVFAADDFGGPNGDSVAASPKNYGTKEIEVASAVGFAVGQWVIVNNLVGLEVSVVKISAINGNLLEFESDVLIPVEGGATIRTVNNEVEVVNGPDYSVNEANGQVTVFDTASTRNKTIFIDYVTLCQDYGGCDFWLIEGEHPITGTDDDYIKPQEVSSFLNAELIGSSEPGDTSFEFRKEGSCLGRDFTLYCIAKDLESIVNPSLVRAVAFTFIPARPTTISTEVGDNRVTISWNDTTEDGSECEGYNVVRSNGATFNAANSQRINSVLIAASGGPNFVDQEGAPNRVAIESVPAPVNGNSFSYAVESGITTSLWNQITRNTRFGVLEITEAVRALSD